MSAPRTMQRTQPTRPSFKACLLLIGTPHLIETLMGLLNTESAQRDRPSDPRFARPRFNFRPRPERFGCDTRYLLSTAKLNSPHQTDRLRSSCSLFGRSCGAVGKFVFQHSNRVSINTENNEGKNVTQHKTKNPNSQRCDEIQSCNHPRSFTKRVCKRLTARES